jgi:tetratricopeptide (TPR) repeat protein
MAEVHLATRRFEEARALYEALHAEGEPVLESLLQATRSTATQAMLDKDRGLQVACLLRMRELGVPLADLGFGAVVLRQEAERLVERAADAFELAERLQADPELPSAAFEELMQAKVREMETSEALLRRALVYDPLSLEAHHRLGETLFRLGSYELAAREWEAVLNLADDPEQLGSAVHLNLARAWKQAGRDDLAREACASYLADHPTGQWVDDTQELLERLP